MKRNYIVQRATVFQIMPYSIVMILFHIFITFGMFFSGIAFKIDTGKFKENKLILEEGLAIIRLSMDEFNGQLNFIVYFSF